jgi:aromatic aminotransferase
VEKEVQEPVISLAQGVVRWGVGDAVDVAAAMRECEEGGGNAEKSGGGNTVDRYGAVEGIPELREAAIASRNRFSGKIDSEQSELNCIVTAGSNQGFMSVVMATCDAGDTAVLLTPYFFNHRMALDLAGVSCAAISPAAGSFLPNWEELERSIAGADGRARLLVVVNPSNPSGAVFGAEDMARLVELTARHDMWLCCDEAYADFVFDEEDNAVPHTLVSPRGPHVITLRSMSKAYGAAGWRVGFVFHDSSRLDLAEALAKVQDTIPINAPQLSQRVALRALTDPNVDRWVRDNIQSLGENRKLLREAIHDVGGHDSRGGLYFLVTLPPGVHDHDAVQFLCMKFRVLVVPCSESGLPSTIRVSYGNLMPAQIRIAAGRLRRGLLALRAGATSQLSHVASPELTMQPPTKRARTTLLFSPEDSLGLNAQSAPVTPILAGRTPRRKRETPQRVQFQEKVSVLEFSREISQCAVPFEGAFPLGLSPKPIREIRVDLSPGPTSALALPGDEIGPPVVAEEERKALLAAAGEAKVDRKSQAKQIQKARKKVRVGCDCSPTAVPDSSDFVCCQALPATGRQGCFCRRSGLDCSTSSCTCFDPDSGTADPCHNRDAAAKPILTKDEKFQHLAQYVQAGNWQDDRYARYADLAARVASFSDVAGVSFPLSSPSPDRLAAAGFFYHPATGFLDQCRCFSCGLTLNGWEEGDDPIQEHSSQDSVVECEYLRGLSRLRG